MADKAVACTRIPASAERSSWLTLAMNCVLADSIFSAAVRIFGLAAIQLGVLHGNPELAGQGEQLGQLLTAQVRTWLRTVEVEQADDCAAQPDWEHDAGMDVGPQGVFGKTQAATRVGDKDRLVAKECLGEQARWLQPSAPGGERSAWRTGRLQYPPFLVPAVEKGTVVPVVGADDVGHFLHQGIGIKQRADAMADGKACLQLQSALLRDLVQLLDQVAGQSGRGEQAIGRQRRQRSGA